MLIRLSLVRCIGAEDGIRTRDPDLGKVVLYQLSYFRVEAFLGWPIIAPRKTPQTPFEDTIRERPYGTFITNILSTITSVSLADDVVWEMGDSNPLTLSQYVTVKGTGFTDPRR